MNLNQGLYTSFRIVVNWKISMKQRYLNTLSRFRDALVVVMSSVEREIQDGMGIHSMYNESFQSQHEWEVITKHLIIFPVFFDQQSYGKLYGIGWFGYGYAWLVF